MTPTRALTHQIGEATIMHDIAQAAYNAALRRAYRTNGIPEKRAAMRGYQAQITGLLAKLREGRKSELEGMRLKGRLKGNLI